MERYRLSVLVEHGVEVLLSLPERRISRLHVGDAVGGAERLLRDLLRSDRARAEVVREGVEGHLVPPGEGDGTIEMGYMDSHFKRAWRLTLKDQSIADEALADMPEPYRRLDTAVLESIMLKGALGMTEDDISHLDGLAYSKSFDDAYDAVETGRADAGFFMRATPVEQVQEVAEAGESMPPKSTYFFPKVLTGMVFNPLTD